MNTVSVLSQNTVPHIAVVKGQFWKDPETNCIFIIGNQASSISNCDYVAINLANGCSWNCEAKTPEEAVKGLVFLGSQADITLRIRRV